MLLELIQIQKDENVPIFRQISLQIIDMIKTGVITPGYKIPGSRKMADHMNLNRQTVVSALDQLVIEGWLETIPGKGTFVTESLESTPQKLEALQNPQNQAPELVLPDSLKRELSLVTHPYHLDDGFPDPRLAPVAELARAYKSSLTKGNIYSRFGYGDPKGNVHLRQSLCSYLLETRGMKLNKDEIIITRGVTNALYLAIQSFLKPGDQVAVPELNWESANANFRHHGIELIKVKVDHDGLDTDHLEELIGKADIKMVYLTPHHQYPTTVIMPASRRIKLIQLARAHQFYVFEDDYDYDFHYSPHPVMPLASTDHGGFVIYAGSFTKAISPVFRVGYLIANENQVNYLSRLRRMVDRQGDTILELAIAELLELGIIQRLLKKNRKLYEQRRNHLRDLLHQHLQHVTSFETPLGGMSFWTHFDPVIDLKVLAQKAAREDLYIGSEAFFKSSGEKVNAVRLGFASSTEDELTHAIEIIKRLI